eukprot:INCI4960.1.p1 GENE.INCI4960.1~~INCI4960.1.p1  ORF type:complete len:715 (+),score=148.65 INCI4960.1:440-2584(+)
MGNGAGKPVRMSASARKLQGFMEDISNFYAEEDEALAELHGDNDNNNNGSGGKDDEDHNEAARLNATMSSSSSSSSSASNKNLTAELTFPRNGPPPGSGMFVPTAGSSGSLHVQASRSERSLSGVSSAHSSARSLGEEGRTQSDGSLGDSGKVDNEEEDKNGRGGGGGGGPSALASSRSLQGSPPSHNNQKDATNDPVVRVEFDLTVLEREVDGMWAACAWLIKYAPRSFLNGALAPSGLGPVLDQVFTVLDADDGPYNRFGGRSAPSQPAQHVDAAPSACTDERHLTELFAALRRECMSRRTILDPGKRFRLPTRGTAGTLCRELTIAAELADDVRLLSALQCYAGTALTPPASVAQAQFYSPTTVGTDGKRHVPALSPNSRSKALVLKDREARDIDPAMIVAAAIYVSTALRVRAVAQAFELRDTEQLAESIRALCADLGDNREVLKGNDEGRRLASAAPNSARQKLVGSHSLSSSALSAAVLQVSAADLMLGALAIEIDICDCVLDNQPSMLSHKLMRLRVLLYNVANLAADLKHASPNASASSLATSPSKPVSPNGHRPTSSPTHRNWRNGRGGPMFALMCSTILGDILERVHARLTELSEHEHVLQKALLLYQSIHEWLSGLADGTFFHSVVAETKDQFETSVRIRNLASIKASCSTCECLLGIQKANPAARDLGPESIPSQSDKTANLAALLKDFNSVRISKAGDVFV